MGLIELICIAVGLSMDAFAVAICKGLSLRKCTWQKQGIVGLYFGGNATFRILAWHTI